MPDRQPSRTAQGVAFLRAVHQIIDAKPPILDDSVIVALVDQEALGRVRRDPSVAQTSAARGLRAHVVLRSRFAEDRLAAGVRRGVAQYIVLGAGFDTFAYRQPEWARAIRVIEVDQPASQMQKRARLSEMCVAVPGNVLFADVDFECESLRDGLVRHNVSLTRPTFFSWLGVTMYLTEEAVDAVLQTVAAFPAESEIVLTFSQPHPVPTSGEPPSLADRAATLGEPWISYFEPGDIERKLRNFGFRMVEFLTPDLAATRYFRGRVDELPPPRRTAIVSAIR